MTTPTRQPMPDLGEALHRIAVLRTWTVIVLVFVLLAILAVRSLADHSAPAISPLISTLCLVVFEVAMLAVLYRRDPKRGVPTWMIVAQTVVECSSPSLTALGSWMNGSVDAWVMIVSPGLIANTMYILLAILHLRPWLTALAGLICVMEHTALVSIAITDDDVRTSDISTGLLVTYPLFFAIVGAIAVFVTLLLRQYVGSAIVEATQLAAAEGEIRAASDVQQHLLPSQPPTLPGWQVAGWSRPAEQNGGDYWDWLALRSGKVAVSIADVAGHGLGPALVTAVCRSYARGSLRDWPNLADAVRRVAQLLVEDMPEGRFVTYAVTLITPAPNPAAPARLPLLSAGHGPSLLVHAQDGRVDQLNADDLPLGVTADMEFTHVRELTLEPGDTLVLLTDGFFEWQNPDGEQWGIDRLVESAARHRDAAPDAMIAAILADAEAFVDRAPQEDDLTMVVIQRETR
ncbi:MAG: PP2C family protein-serine/threonine phosphatase [Planctomycetota bacterium]